MTSISKKCVFWWIDDIANKYNTYRTTKINPVDVKAYKIMKNEWSCKNIKRFTLQIGIEVFVIKKVKNTVPWTYVIEDLN